MNRRELALKSLMNILEGSTLPQAISGLKLSSAQDEAWVMALVEGSCRYYHRFKTCLNATLLKQPLSQDLHSVETVLILALYELSFMKTPSYAVVNEWVALMDVIKKSHHKALVNAICRRYLREKANFDLEQYPNVPSWLGKKYRQAYPAQAAAIFKAQDQTPPLFLRINRHKVSVSDFIIALKKVGYEASLCSELDSCVILNTTSTIPDLPGYTQGWFYVQDRSAQCAAPLLTCQPHQNILDVCAAPGGKTLHLLEREPSLHITATDISASRLALMQENLQRCDAQVNLVQQDMTTTPLPFTTHQFDCILLDAPCSGTGVIRRHPDIKLVRHSQDIQELKRTQAALLHSVWPLLKPSGKLLYVTCSILPEENEEQIAAFMKQHADASALPVSLNQGFSKSLGWQILPEIGGGDGLYYALLTKAMKF